MFWLTVSVLAFLLDVGLAQSLSVNVTRSKQDVIRVSPWDCSYCAKFNMQATCSTSTSQCQCPKDHSTFLIHNRTCVSASDLVKENKCLSRKDDQVIDFLDVVDLTSSTTITYQYPRNLANCTVRTQKFCYLRREGGWECTDLSGVQVFRVKSASKDSKSISLDISGSSDLDLSHCGRIIRVELSCNASSRRETSEEKSCILLKAKGTLTAKSPKTTGSPSQEKSTAINKEPDVEGSTTPITKSTLSSRTRQISDYQHSTRPITTVDLTKINGAVSVDDEDEEHEVIVATISVAGAIICVLIICVFTWLIIRHRHRSRRHDETNTPTGIAIVNGNCRGIIPLSMVTRVCDPFYSELPDIIESTNNKALTSSTPTLNDINRDFFIVQNPSHYNTLPKARKNTDPLPVPPALRPRPRTPEPRMTYRTRTCADNTNTARFLSQASLDKCMSLDRFLTKPRERSSTDVDMLDDVFCQDFLGGLEIDGKEPDSSGEEDERREHRTDSFYEDLQSSMDRKTTIYESLHNATKESPKARLSTLERIKQDTRYHDNDGLNLRDELEPWYHILESSTNDDFAITSIDNPALSSCDVSDDGEDCLHSPAEYHILEEPDPTNLERELHTSEEGHFSDRDIGTICRQKVHKSVSDTRLNRFMDYCDIVPEDDKGAFLVKKKLRQRSHSFHG